MLASKAGLGMGVSGLAPSWPCSMLELHTIQLLQPFPKKGYFAHVPCLFWCTDVSFVVLYLCLHVVYLVLEPLLLTETRHPASQLDLYSNYI